MSIPDSGAAACYFCLEEEADEEEMPPVRDCSCRGDSAGFAHFSCLAKYAEQKCKRAVEGDMPSFIEPWEKCNNCKQPFQNQLSVDLSSAFISFAEASYGHPDSSKWDKMKVMESLRLKIDALSNMAHTDNSNKAIKVEMTNITNSLLSMIDQTKKDLKMSRWVHMPQESEEYQYHRMLCVGYEAYAHEQLGTMLRNVTDKEGFNVKIMHWKKARAIFNLVGMTDTANEMDTIISWCTSKTQAANDGEASYTGTKSAVEFMRNEYDRNLNKFGMSSEATISIGLNYAEMLWKVDRCIEAERLFSDRQSPRPWPRPQNYNKGSTKNDIKSGGGRSRSSTMNDKNMKMAVVVPVMIVMVYKCISLSDECR